MHSLHHLLGHCQTDACSLSGGVVLALVERIKDMRQVFGVDSLAGIADGKQQLFTFITACQRHFAARWGVLQGIHQQIPKHLPQTQCITLDKARQLFQLWPAEPKPLLECHLGVDFQHIPQERMKIHPMLLNLHVTAFQLGKIQNLIDNMLQILRASSGAQQIFLLLLGQITVQYEIEHPRHTIDWRAKLMAHRSHELPLCPACCLGLHTRRLQLLLPLFALGNVNQGYNDLLAMLQENLGNKDIQPDQFPFFALHAVHRYGEFTREIIIHNGRFQILPNRTVTAIRPMTATMRQTVLALERIPELESDDFPITHSHGFHHRIVEVNNLTLCIEYAKPDFGSLEHGMHIDMVRLQFHLQPSQMRNIPKHDGATAQLPLFPINRGTGSRKIHCAA